MTTATGGVLTPFAYGRGWPALNRPRQATPGVPVRFSVEGSRNRRILTVSATLTTSAVVGSRVPELSFDDGDGVTWAVYPRLSTVVVSSTATTLWAVGVSSFASGLTGADVVAIADLVMLPGHRITVTASGLDAGDTITGVAVYSEEFPIDSSGYPTGVIPASAMVGTPIP